MRSLRSRPFELLFLSSILPHTTGRVWFSVRLVLGSPFLVFQDSDDRPTIMFRRVRVTWTLAGVSFVDISGYDGGVETYPTLCSLIQKVQVLRRYIVP